eukprot:355101-Chlamydomonas_euryale.AAC.3
MQHTTGQHLPQEPPPPVPCHAWCWLGVQHPPWSRPLAEILQQIPAGRTAAAHRILHVLLEQYVPNDTVRANATMRRINDRPSLTRLFS